MKKLKKVLNIYKPLGMTPLEAIQKFKKKNPEYQDEKMGYAGRLDPMAQGVLVVLVGDENKKITNYMKLDKTYEAQIVIGLKTDTYDVLGISNITNEIGDFRELLKIIKTCGTQKIPIYSSYIVKGKPLFWYARNNKKVKLPVNKIKIKSLKIKGVKKISSSKLLKEITMKIGKVNGDFRQKQILAKWDKVLSKKKEYSVVNLRISCSSGTYIRAIADEINGVLFNLIRVKLGKFNEKSSLKL